MRSLSIVLILGMLAACASSGGYLEYKPEHWKGQLWAITGTADDGPDKDTVIISINNSDVIIGDLSEQDPEDVFTGTYEDYDISANCKLVGAGSGSSKHNCTVSVDGKPAGRLSF